MTKWFCRFQIEKLQNFGKFSVYFYFLFHMLYTSAHVIFIQNRHKPRLQLHFNKKKKYMQPNCCCFFSVNHFNARHFVWMWIMRNACYSVQIGWYTRNGTRNEFRRQYRNKQKKSTVLTMTKEIKLKKKNNSNWEREEKNGNTINNTKIHAYYNFGLCIYNTILHTIVNSPSMNMK